MIRVGLVPTGHIRSVVRLPGRVLHVRLLFEVPLDILVVYQFAWNPHKQSLQGNKCEALVKQRRRVWKLMDQWLRSVPHRNGCLLVGDFNVPVATERPIAGDGITSASGQQQDQTAFQEALRTHSCCVLNTWTGRGQTARTYIPPQQDGQGLGTQIDFFIVRGHLADDVAKRAAPFDAPFVLATGCRHRPIRTTIVAPRRPRQSQTVGMGRPNITISCRFVSTSGCRVSRSLFWTR